MGTTFCSIHVYSDMPPEGASFPFICLSKGWQTHIPECDDPCDPMQTQAIARKISKCTDAPVLWFYELDGDALCLKCYVNGKQAASWSAEGSIPNKNVSKIPDLVGYAGKGKQRLNKILQCSDIDLQTELLEEYFGVCLLPIPEVLEEDPQSLVRQRTDALYKEYIAEEKRLTGASAPIRAEVIQELEGMINDIDWHFQWFDKKQFRGQNNFKPHYYLWYEAAITGVEYLPIRFFEGRMEFITQEQMRAEGADKPYPPRYIGDDPRYEKAYWPTRLYFADTAPEAYRGKEMQLPRGWYGLGFDAKGRLLLHDDKCTFAVMDENMQIIAKQRLKGRIWDQDGDYILAFDTNWFTGTIRVYRICDMKDLQ